MHTGCLSGERFQFACIAEFYSGDSNVLTVNFPGDIDCLRVAVFWRVSFAIQGFFLDLTVQ